MIVGVYLCVHFAHLVPWAAELFSSGGLLPDARLSPFSRLFPNLLAVADAPMFVTGFVALAAVASLLLAAGVADRVCAVVLFYVLACLYGRNPLVANPSLPFVGWLLLAHASLRSLPAGVGLWRPEDPDDRFQMSRAMQTAAWLLLAAGYSFSGYTKLVSPSWLDGTAVARVLGSPLARPGWLRDALLSLPPGMLRVASYAASGARARVLAARARSPAAPLGVGRNGRHASVAHRARGVRGPQLRHDRLPPVRRRSPAWLPAKRRGG